MNETAKKELLERFNRLYKDCTLFCVQFDGFSHALYYKDKDGKRHHEDYSAYAPEQHEEDRERFRTDGNMVIYSFNKDITKAFFLGYAHYAFQNNAQEVIFKDVEEWC